MSAADFLGNTLKAGDLIVYPSRCGLSMGLNEARILYVLENGALLVTKIPERKEAKIINTPLCILIQEKKGIQNGGSYPSQALDAEPSEERKEPSFPEALPSGGPTGGEEEPKGNASGVGGDGAYHTVQHASACYPYDSLAKSGAGEAEG